MFAPLLPLPFLVYASCLVFSHVSTSTALVKATMCFPWQTLLTSVPAPLELQDDLEPYVFAGYKTVHDGDVDLFFPGNYFQL